MKHSIRLFLVSILWLGIAPSAEGTDAVSTLTAQLEVERQLLAEDIRLFSAAREQQKEALDKLSTALAAIDAFVEGRSVSVSELERLEAEAGLAEVSAAAANIRAGEVRRRVYDRLRTTSALQGTIEKQADRSIPLAEPLSGRWSLEIDPGDQEGWLELRFSSDAVTGFYRLEDGVGGTLRGTYSGGNIRLEKIDALKGFDAVWVGEINPVNRTITGTWTSTEESEELSFEGDWKAERLPDEERDLGGPAVP